VDEPGGRGQTGQVQRDGVDASAAHTAACGARAVNMHGAAGPPTLRPALPPRACPAGRFLAFHQQFSLVTATLLRAGASLAHFLVGACLAAAAVPWRAHASRRSAPLQGRGAHRKLTACTCARLRAPVFAIVLVMYAFVGFNMLGHKLERYNTLGKAINSMCSMLVFDDTVSFADIMDVAPLVGPVFYWSYFILSSLMLINVLLAILLDAYASVSRASRTTNFIWVDLIVQYRLFRTSLTDRSVYPSLVRAEERVRVVGFKRTHLNLAQAYSLLQLEQLPSFAVWNLVLVLERKALADLKDAEEKTMAEQMTSMHQLRQKMAAQLKQTHKLVARGHHDVFVRFPFAWRTPSASAVRSLHSSASGAWWRWLTHWTGLTSNSSSDG